MKQARLDFHVIALFLAASTAFFQMPAYAEEAQIPRIILDGLEAYHSEGASAAIQAWIQGGPIQGDKNAMASVNSFKQIEIYYGKYVGYHLISVVTLTPISKIIYLQMDYDKGPLFTRFLCYWTGSDWVVTGSLNFNLDPSQVLPAALLGNERSIDREKSMKEIMDKL